MLEFQTDPVGVGLFLCKQLFSFATINLHRCWPCEWKRSIMTDYVTGRDEVNLQSILIGSWTDEMGLSHLLGTASFVPQENINLLTVCWSMTWWLNIFVLMDFDTKHTDNKIWPIFRISEILTKTKKEQNKAGWKNWKVAKGVALDRKCWPGSMEAYAPTGVMRHNDNDDDDQTSLINNNCHNA